MRKLAGIIAIGILIFCFSTVALADDRRDFHFFDDEVLKIILLKEVFDDDDDRDKDRFHKFDKHKE